jgi:hypothetical protein
MNLMHSRDPFCNLHHNATAPINIYILGATGTTAEPPLPRIEADYPWGDVPHAVLDPRRDSDVAGVPRLS